MPSLTSRTAARDELLVNAVHYARILRQTRRESSMGLVFHLANYKHWHDLGNEKVKTRLQTGPEAPLMTQSMSSMSSRIILQMLQATDHPPTQSVLDLHAIADTELESLLTLLQQRAEAQDYALTPLDAFDVFGIGVYEVDKRLKSTGQQSSLLESPIRKCLELLTVVAERFTSLRRLRDALWDFAALVDAGGPSVEADVLQVNRVCQTERWNIPFRTHAQMRAIIMRKWNC